MAASDKREEVVRVALELIAKYGFHGAPISLIAKQANVGTGTIYRYFESKDVLITELYQDLEERMYPVILEGYISDNPIRQRFRHIGTALLRYLIENPVDFRYLEQFHNSPYGAAYRRSMILGEKEGRDVFRELFEDGVAQQVMKDLPLIIQFALSFGPLMAVARDHILNFIELDEHLISLTVDACWDSVRQ